MAKRSINERLTETTGEMLQNNLVQHMWQVGHSGTILVSLEITYIGMRFLFEPVPFFSQQISLDETISFYRIITNVWLIQEVHYL
ncbi:hypothetical protein O9992_25830 [Vibrio lentus]|nr:hypothetical protein [Vibrio lentus]